MQRVTRSEILGLGEYEQIRERFRARIIADKKTRRIVVCDEISAIFENHDTALFQIQEMLRTERITKESGIEHEIETYNQLVPDAGELSATMFVEIADTAVRDRRLVELAGLEKTIALEIDGQLVRARNETHGVLPDRTTAVHYVKFTLSPEQALAFRNAGKSGAPLPAAFVLDHPHLSARKALPPEVIAALAEDL